MKKPLDWSELFIVVSLFIFLVWFMNASSQGDRDARRIDALETAVAQKGE